MMDSNKYMSSHAERGDYTRIVQDRNITAGGHSVISSLSLCVYNQRFHQRPVLPPRLSSYRITSAMHRADCASEDELAELRKPRTFCSLSLYVNQKASRLWPK